MSYQGRAAVTILTLAPWAALKQIGLVLSAVAPPIEPRVVQPLSLQGILKGEDQYDLAPCTS